MSETPHSSDSASDLDEPSEKQPTPNTSPEQTSDQSAPTPIASAPASTSPQAAPPRTDPTRTGPRVLPSETLFVGAREIHIRHGEDTYRLMITRNDKLILQK